MANQKDRHLESPGEANRDKHINFLAIENGDVDPSSEDTNEENAEESATVDNGFFTDDDSTLQTEEEHEKDKGMYAVKNEKSTPLSPGDTPTLADKINVNSNNEDLVTPVKDDDTKPYINEDDQAH